MADAGIGVLGVKLSLDSADFGAGLDRAAAISQREMAKIERANKTAAKEADRFIAVIQRQVDTFGLSGAALQRYEANLKGASDRAGPLIDKLEQMRAAQVAANSASDASASAGAKFVSSLNEQVSAFGKSSTELLAMKAAQLGVSESASGLIAKLEQLQAAEREAAAASAAAARSSAEQVASQRAAATAQQAFIDGLQREAESIGRTRAELLTLKAAQLGVADSAAPLIAQTERLQAAERAKAAAQQASTRAAQEAAAAERAVAQTRLSFLDSLQREADAIGKTRTELLSLRAAELGVGEAATANIAKINAASSALNRHGVSAGQTRAAFGMLPAQITDIVTQLAGGQNPLLILIQQGGQIKDSFGGIGAALSALGSLITPVTVAIAALAAVGGGLAYAFGSGSEESAKLGRALQATGGYAGITAGQFEVMAHSIAEATNTSIGSTKDVLQALVASGRFSGETLATAGTAAQQFAKATGESADSVVQKFVSMADNVGSGAETLNRQVHSLTTEYLEQIKTLDEQGRHQEALKLALAGLSDGVSAAAQNLGTFARAWGAVGREASKAIDAMKKIGTIKTPEEALADIEARVRGLDSPRTAGNPLADAMLGRRDALKETLTFQQSIMRNEVAIGQVGAANESRRLQVEEARVKLNKELEATKSRQQKREDELAKANGLIDSAGGTAAQRSQLIANINEKFKDPKGPKGAADNPGKNLRDNDLKDQERYIAAERDLATQRNRFLDLYNGQGLISIQSYYDAKRAILDAATTSAVAAYDKEIAALEAYQAKQKRATDKAETQGKINDATGKRDKLLADAGASTIELSVQQTAAEEAFRRSIANTSAEVLTLQQRLGEAAAIRFDATNASMLKSLQANQRVDPRATDPVAAQALAAEAAAGEARLKKLREYTIAQAKYTEQSTEATRVTDSLGIAESRIALSEKLGATTTLSALQQVGAARQAAVTQMESIVAAEEAIARASGTPALIQQAERARLALEQLRGSADVLGDRFRTIFESAGADAFADFITGSKTASQAFSSFANSILRDLSRIASQQITSGLTGQGSWLSGLINAAVGYFGGSSYGGSVPGGTGVAGSVGNNPSAFISPSANGNAFDPAGRISAFAAGGVFHKPTMFAYGGGNLGIMGEAGPEAVMPLKRGSDGKLGVVSAGAASNINISVRNEEGGTVKASATATRNGRDVDIEVLVRRISSDQINNEVAGGGKLADTLGRTYGLNRAAGVSRGA